MSHCLQLVRAYAATDRFEVVHFEFLQEAIRHKLPQDR
jgi:hypothetical protein